MGSIAYLFFEYIFLIHGEQIVKKKPHDEQYTLSHAQMKSINHSDATVSVWPLNVHELHSICCLAEQPTAECGQPKNEFWWFLLEVESDYDYVKYKRIPYTSLM